MADNTDEANVDNPKVPQRENPLEESIPTSTPDTINPIQETENMEVHKHPHHITHKKKWGEYLLEFCMLFLAVFLGFVAENIRETSVERHREKEYIISMIEDAKTDTANLHKSIASNTLRDNRLDTLESLCLNYNISGNDDKDIIRLFRYGQSYANVVTLTERTIQQLKNAGGMRLIKKKAAVDAIILYDDMAKKLANQQAYYELYQNKSIDVGAQIMNYKNLGFHSNDPLFKNGIDTSKKLIIKDKLKIIEFGNMIDMYQGVVDFYIQRLQEANEHAVKLINTLQKEYNLKDE